jgi:hypothetical protein
MLTGLRVGQSLIVDPRSLHPGALASVGEPAQGGTSVASAVVVYGRRTGGFGTPDDHARDHRVASAARAIASRFPPSGGWQTVTSVAVGRGGKLREESCTSVLGTLALR